MQSDRVHLHPNLVPEQRQQGGLLQLDRHDRLLVQRHPAGPVPIPSGGEVLQDPLDEDRVRVLRGLDAAVPDRDHPGGDGRGQRAFCGLREFLHF